MLPANRHCSSSTGTDQRPYLLITYATSSSVVSRVTLITGRCSSDRKRLWGAATSSLLIGTTLIRCPCPSTTYTIGAASQPPPARIITSASATVAASGIEATDGDISRAAVPSL